MHENIKEFIIYIYKNIYKKKEINSFNKTNANISFFFYIIQTLLDI